MYFRPKTKRRLLTLLAAGAIVTGAASAGIVVQLHRYEHRREGYLIAGMNAYASADYHTAVRALTKYVGNDHMDADAIFALAVSRTKLPRADMSHLIDAKGLFNRYLELNPTDVNAQHQLLDIYRKLGYRGETATLANSLLAINPNDVPALSAKVQQLIHDGDPAAALPLSMRLNDLTPLDVRAHATTYELMNRLHRDPSDLIGRADRMLVAHPDDPRFELLRAIAAYNINDSAGTTTWLRTAANHDTSDADLTLLLVGALDRQGLWNDSFALLYKAGNNSSASTTIQAALIQRLWELKQYDAALSRMNNIKPSDVAADSNLLGLKALVLASQIRGGNLSATTKPSELSEIRAALQARPDDLIAAAWNLVLSAISPEPVDVLQRVRLCESAERMNPDNPDTPFVLGTQYLQLGETEMAREELTRVSELQPEWAAPYTMIARILLDRGEAVNAAAAAEAACDRDTHFDSAHALLALAKYKQLSASASPREVQPVLDEVRQARISNPNSPRLLPAHIDLLSRANQKQQATDLLRASLSSLLHSTSGLLELAKVDHSDSLGMMNLITNQALQCQPSNAEDALAQVQVCSIANNIAAANAMLASIASHDSPAWIVATLQAREALGSTDTDAGWQKVAASHPHDLGVQQAVLRSPVASKDRMLVDETISRLKLLTGDDGVEWKLARAQWQLDAPDDQKNNANAAAVSMSDVVRVLPRYAKPQTLWADALLKLGDIAGATAHLRIAISLDPGNNDISQRLDKLLKQAR